MSVGTVYPTTNPFPDSSGSFFRFTTLVDTASLLIGETLQMYVRFTNHIDIEITKNNKTTNDQH